MIYKAAALVELFLVLIENSGYVHTSLLPLGGGQIQQMGVVFATAHLIAEARQLLKRYRRTRASQHTREHPLPTASVSAQRSR